VGTISFNVSVVRQTSGGGDHLVKYDAVLQLSGRNGAVRVEMVSVYPANADPTMVQEAIESVERGAVRALAGNAAVLWLHNFVIHPTDFRPSKCEEYTFEAIREAVRNVR
jgi:hypothetical protein